LKNELSQRYRELISQLKKTDPRLVTILIACAYVNRCRTLVSMDMLFGLLRGNHQGYPDIASLLTQLSGEIVDFWGEVKSEDQSFFKTRSSFLSSIIFDVCERSDLRAMLESFHRNVPKENIVRYDKFKRKGYDADFIVRSFPRWQDGLAFYQYLFKVHDSPYTYQQAALYLQRLKRYSEAFSHINEAYRRDGERIPTIRNSYAVILFNANFNQLASDRSVMKYLVESMQILEDCYNKDYRRTYHIKNYARQALQLNHFEQNNESISMLISAKSWIEKEIEESQWNDASMKALLRSIETQIRYVKQ
jgi:hypothetical protein